MKLYYDKRLADPTYYAQQGIRNGKKTTTKNVKKFGKHSELLKITDDPLTYVKEEIKKMNEEYRVGKVELSYSADFKKMCVKAVLDGEGSVDDIVVKYNISSRRLLRSWISRYNANIELKDYIPKNKIMGIVVPNELANVSPKEVRILPYNIINYNYVLGNVWEYVRYLCGYGHNVKIDELNLLCDDLKIAAISLKSLDKNSEDYNKLKEQIKTTKKEMKEINKFNQNIQKEKTHRLKAIQTK